MLLYRARLNEARQVAMGHATLGHTGPACAGCARRRHVRTAQEAPASGEIGASPSPEVPRPPNKASGKPCKDQVNDPLQDKRQDPSTDPKPS